MTATRLDRTRIRLLLERGDVTRLFADQLAWARDREHRRLLDERASRDAVAVAADSCSVTLRA